MNLPPRSPRSSAHFFYRDPNSHPVYLSPFDTYRIVDTFTTVQILDGVETYVFHHVIEDAPSTVRFR